MKIYSSPHVAKQSPAFPPTNTDEFSKRYGDKLNKIFEHFCDTYGTSNYKVFWRRALANNVRYYRPIAFAPLGIKKEPGGDAFILIQKAWNNRIIDGYLAWTLDEKARRQWLSSTMNVSAPLEKIPPHDCEDFYFEAPVGYPYTTKTDTARTFAITLNDGW